MKELVHAPGPRVPAQIGRYTILGELGQGGMAILYLGRAMGPGGFERLTAIKMIHEQYGRERAFIDMFLDEARVAARIHHPNVVPVYEVGEQDGRFYIAMDYVIGETLAVVLKHAWRKGSRLGIDIAVSIIATICEALHACHELRTPGGVLLGVVHRDVSPQNIMVGYDGIPRIMDFGVARATDQLSHTRPGVQKGKVAYMAPEQVMGGPSDRRLDVFALGVVLWEATVGKRLFKAPNDFATAQRVREGRIPLPSSLRPDCPPALDEIIMQALRRNPEERFATARELGDALRSFSSLEGPMPGAGELERFMRASFPEQYAARLEMIQRAVEPNAVLVRQPDGDEVPSLSQVGPLDPDDEVTREDVVFEEHPDLGETALEDAFVASVSAAGGEPTAARPLAEMNPPARSRKPLTFALAAGVLGLLGTLVVGALTPGERSEAPATSAPPEPQTLAPTPAAPTKTETPATPALEVPPPEVTFSFTVTPPDAEIRIDGQLVGRTFRLPQSNHERHQLELSAPNHKPESRSLIADVSRSFEIKLQKLEPPPPVVAKPKPIIKRPRATPPTPAKPKRVLLGADDL